MRKYVFLGDSLIYGYGVSPRDNWVYKLKNTLNLNLYNKGINGSTTTDMLIRFEEDVLSLTLLMYLLWVAQMTCFQIVVYNLLLII